MPDAFKRYMIIECEKLNVQELKEYMKELGQKLCGLEPGTLEYSIALSMLNIACDVHDSKQRGMRPRRKI